MNDVVIADYLRTAQSRSRPSAPERDWFHQLRADELLARLIPAILSRCDIPSAKIDDCIVGSALGVSEQWTFGGRTPVFLAGMDAGVPAKFIDQQCGSGMAAVQTGFMEIATGFADMVLACGMEHMTRVPMGPTLFENGAMSVNPDLYSAEKYSEWDMPTTMNMGLTAEKLADIAGITREEMDLWAVRSHQRAATAAEAGFFAGEILPISAPQADGSFTTIERDQAVRPGTDVAGTAGLKPIFRADGKVTAGNASPLSAGAAAMLLTTREKALALNIKPLATIRSIGFAGVDPTLMGEGPVPATRKALENAGLQPEDIDVWEINEAFSVVVLNCIRKFNIDPDRVNIHGGGIALGHPLGATGVRLTGTLARIMAEKECRYGCATACIGGGQGISIILERE
ncbi:acetyl-CoA C-acetyltransferase [Desulfosediminicola flagellatus]|uniref:acetyl-CoA C-acetyltransferase n=1 Tax=Desulfosediminicola flagellatus TaxID=2569541 RepID=UPI0010AC6FDF|nr:acetyl-CoA C-acetyltransferase [Desulfosediminicola flagellatus]